MHKKTLWIVIKWCEPHVIISVVIPRSYYSPISRSSSCLSLCLNYRDPFRHLWIYCHVIISWMNYTAPAPRRCIQTCVIYDPRLIPGCTRRLRYVLHASTIMGQRKHDHLHQRGISPIVIACTWVPSAREERDQIRSAGWDGRVSVYNKYNSSCHSLHPPVLVLFLIMPASSSQLCLGCWWWSSSVIH